MKDQAAEWARGAGKILLDHFGKAEVLRCKDNQSNVVTEADLASERYLIDRIRSEYPGHGIIGEESGRHPGSAELTWVIDPLDGTSNFAAGIPWFGVLIALLKHSEPVLGIIYLPVTDDLYVAEKGGGAFCNGRQISVTREEQLSQVLFAYGMDIVDDTSVMRARAEFLAGLLGQVRNIRATNSLVDAAYTADGRLGGFVNFHTFIWDIAASWLIVREAGGSFTDLSGRELRFNVTEQACSIVYSVLAAARLLHPRVVRLAAAARI